MNNPGNSPTVMHIWTTKIGSIHCEKTKDEVVMEDNERILKRKLK